MGPTKATTLYICFPYLIKLLQRVQTGLHARHRIHQSPREILANLTRNVGVYNLLVTNDQTRKSIRYPRHVSRDRFLVQLHPLLLPTFSPIPLFYLPLPPLLLLDAVEESCSSLTPCLLLHLTSQISTLRIQTCIITVAGHWSLLSLLYSQ